MLTDRIQTRIEQEYSGPDVRVANEILERMGAELSMWSEVSGGDRIERAALTYAAGEVVRLRWAVELALTDWRDLLVAVGDA